MQFIRIKTITELSHLNGRVYVYLPTSELAEQFMQQAEVEGFTFQDGAKPTKRTPAIVMAVNPDQTLNYVGSIGMIAFGSGAKTVGRKELLRIYYDGLSAFGETH